MLLKNHFLDCSFRCLAILVLCSTSLILEPLVAQANQKVEQSNTNNSNYTLNKNKVTVANFQVLPATLNLFASLAPVPLRLSATRGRIHFIYF